MVGLLCILLCFLVNAHRGRKRAPLSASFDETATIDSSAMGQSGGIVQGHGPHVGHKHVKRKVWRLGKVGVTRKGIKPPKMELAKSGTRVYEKAIRAKRKGGRVVAAAPGRKGWTSFVQTYRERGDTESRMHRMFPMSMPSEMESPSNAGQNMSSSDPGELDSILTLTERHGLRAAPAAPLSVADGTASSLGLPDCANTQVEHA